MILVNDPPDNVLPRLSGGARRFWKHYGLGGTEADGGVTAVTEGGAVVGWVRYVLDGDEMYASGTWVDLPYRRKGLATTMWTKAVDEHRPRRLGVICATPEGTSTMLALERVRPGLYIQVEKFYSERVQPPSPGREV